MSNKLLSFFFIIAINLHAFDIPSLPLNLEANIFPQIVLMQDSDSLKTVNGVVVIMILYEDAYTASAQTLQQEMQKFVSKRNHSYPIEVSMMKYYGGLDLTAVSALVLFPSEDLRQAAESAGDNSVITFSILTEDLKKGALISVAFTDEILIVVNKRQINQSGLFFENSFYSVTKIENPDRW